MSVGGFCYRYFGIHIIFSMQNLRSPASQLFLNILQIRRIKYMSISFGLGEIGIQKIMEDHTNPIRDFLNNLKNFSYMFPGQVYLSIILALIVTILMILYT